MNQQEIEQWIAQNGGQGRVQYQRSTQRVANPAKQMTLADGSDNPSYDPTSPPQIDINEEKWVAVDDKGQPTGAALHVRRRPDGNFDVVDQANPNPTKPVSSQATTPHVEGTPLPGGGFDNSHPIVVNRDASGKQVGAARELTAEERQRWEKENGQQQTASDSKPVDGYPGWTTKTTKVGNDTKTVYINPQGQEAPDPHPQAANPNQGAPTQAADGSWGYWDKSAPGAPKWVAIQGPQGKKYTQVEQDPDSKKWFGLTADGKWESMAGGPGAPSGPTNPGPPMPEIILGHSQEALNSYLDSLNKAVAAGTMTSAERKERWGEAIQVAQTVVNDVGVKQREDESNLNASTNLANARLTAANNGFNSALQFVSGLKTGEGSAGGAAFGALLTLQLAQAQRMGAYDNIVPGTQGSAEGRSIADAAPATTAAVDQNISRLTAPSAAVSAPAVATPPGPAPSAPAPPPSTPAAVQAAATAPAAPAPDVRNSSDMDLPPGTPTAGLERDDDLLTIRDATSGNTFSLRRSDWAKSPQASDPNYTVINAQGAAATPPGAVQAANTPTPDPAVTPQPGDQPNGLPPGQSVLPQPSSTPINLPGEAGYDPTAPQGMMPGSGWAVMAKAMPQQQAANPALSPNPTTPVPMTYAMLHSDAASKPIWKMTAEEYARYKAAGVPDDVIKSIPGRTVA